MNHSDTLPIIPQKSISIVLLSRGDGKFHWALGLAVPDHPFAFRKLHATQLNGPGWEFEDTVHDITKLGARKPLCAVVQIGSIHDTHTSDTIAQLVSTILMQVSVRERKEYVFTCRVWLREALRVLQDHEVIGFIDIDKLEEESIIRGAENDSDVVKGGPYKVYYSKYYNHTAPDV